MGDKKTQPGNPFAGDLEFARQVLGTSPAIIYVFDVQEGKNIFQNRSLNRVLGYPPEAGADPLLAWIQHMHPDDRARFPAHRERMRGLKSDEWVSWEYRLRTPTGDWRWFMSRDALLGSDSAGNAHLIVGTASDITEQKRAEQMKDLVLGEMRHRLKNFNTVIASIARQSRPKTAEDGVGAFNRFVARLLAILDAGDLILATEDRTTDLSALVDIALRPLVANRAQVVVRGPSVRVSEQVAGGLSMAIHELTTNAIKYGALSTADGIVEVKWDLREEASGQHLVLNWQERDGPKISSPGKEGFGTRLLKEVIPNGKTTVEFLPAGLFCRFDFPC